MTIVTFEVDRFFGLFVSTGLFRHHQVILFVILPSPIITHHHPSHHNAPSIRVTLFDDDNGHQADPQTISLEERICRNNCVILPLTNPTTNVFFFADTPFNKTNPTPIESITGRIRSNVVVRSSQFLLSYHR